MQPEFFSLAKVPNWANWVHRARACRADGCYHCKRKIPFPPISSDVLFKTLNVDAASAKTGNADHVPLANSSLLCSPGNRKVGRLGSINSRNSSERMKPIRFDLRKGVGSGEEKTLQSRECAAG